MMERVRKQFNQALAWFAGRERRFGAVSAA